MLGFMLPMTSYSSYLRFYMYDKWTFITLYLFRRGLYLYIYDDDYYYWEEDNYVEFMLFSCSI